MTNYKVKINSRVKFSSALVPAKGVVVGMGSVFNLAGNYFEYNYSNSPEEADLLALKRDWEIVGQNLADTINSNS